MNDEPTITERMDKEIREAETHFRAGSRPTAWFTLAAIAVRALAQIAQTLDYMWEYQTTHGGR